jgi:2,3-bisphosphoglycerate-independent phosphoglycerate mutase
MKYIFILADGMADRPSEQFGGKTPMYVANKPHINALAAGGITGLCQTVPADFSPGSDVANLSILGYPPKDFYKGRSSLEAISAGVPLAQGDLTLRANLVSLSDEANFEDKRLLDYCGGEVTTADAARLIADVQKELDDDVVSVHPSVSFRNILLWHNGATDMIFNPAHEIMGQRLGDNLPQGSMAELAVDYMKKAHEILKNHPYNKEKIANGELPANALWLWGPGVKAALPSFYERYGLKGGVISGVDLIRGIGISAGMDICYLSSATGGVETDFHGKGDVAAAYLKGGGEFIFVHVEAPDESGHQGKAEMKVKAIERIDQETIPPIIKACEDMGEDYRIIVSPDHATPVELRTHTREPIPFVIFDSRYHKMDQSMIHDEESAKKSGILFEDGKSMLLKFFDKDYH